MLNYYLALLDNKLSRLFLIILLIYVAINVFIFEMLYTIVYNRFMLILITVLSVIYFFVDVVINNFKQIYMIPYLSMLNTNNIVSNQPISPELSDVVSNSNSVIPSLLLLVEDIFYIAIKVLFNTIFVFLFKIKFLGLILIIDFLMVLNGLFLLNQKKVLTNEFNYDGLFTGNVDKIGIMDSISSQFSNMIRNTVSNNNYNLTYVCIVITAIYLFIGFNVLTVYDKLFIVIYVINTAKVFTAIQNAVNNYGIILQKKI